MFSSERPSLHLILTLLLGPAIGLLSTTLSGSERPLLSSNTMKNTLALLLAASSTVTAHAATLVVDNRSPRAGDANAGHACGALQDHLRGCQESATGRHLSGAAGFTASR
jgi:hypothetical protein